MKNNAREILQFLTMLAAATGIVYANFRRIRASVFVPIVVYLMHVCVYYSFVFAYHRGAVPPNIYATALAAWTPAVRLHSVLTMIIVLHISGGARKQ